MYAGQLLFPAPDFVVEILLNLIEKGERTIKMQDYALHGVSKYWIIDSVKQFVEQYLLEDHQYVLRVKITEGIIYAKVIKGYSLNLKDIF